MKTSVFVMAMSVSVTAMSAPMTIEGDVVAVHSYWTDDHSRIETDSTIQTADGQQVVVNQFGGTVDGIGMIQMPGERVLEVGMHVAVAAHTGLDVLQQEHVVLDSAKIITDVPGFVRTGPTDSGHYLYWESGCAFVTPDSAGTTAIAGDQELAVIDAAINEWNTRTASCSYFKVVNAGPKPMETTNDKINVIKFRDTPCMCDPTVGTTSWGCRPPVGKSPAKCYAAAAAAITTAVYINDPNSPRDGAIVDADIELNGVDFDISVGGTTNTPHGKCLADLQNTLTHELGHLHGLEHTCRLSQNDPLWKDDQGNLVPVCGTGLPPKITEATMYPTQDCGETKKSTLSDDDIQAICTIYPTAKNPGTCEPVGGTSSGGCCSASRGADRPVGALLLAGVVALWTRRRRHSRGA
ncbi:MAG TPA: MYXO-CTERM sorting domain-containing protein [Kofleriaceae bacterium]|nr:MYXO-CTERM sorting domain-containing protein [Kofleriaceae bacterium]